MRSVVVRPARKKIAGSLSFPGDKSLSHRAVIFGALAEGESRFSNMLASEDCIGTRRAFEAMGVRVDTKSETDWVLHGKGFEGLKVPAGEINCGNSGTTMRLLLGVLAGRDFEAVLTGDPSLSKRPMRRVTDYLKEMGAKIEGREQANFAPLNIKGGKLKGIEANLKIASAQVKSAILLAGLQAKGVTRVTEPVKSRDHTERFLKFFGADVTAGALSVTLRPGRKLKPKSFEIAGDISSAAFFMAAAALVPQAQMRFRNVLWNPTRTGMPRVLERMGVAIKDLSLHSKGPEPAADFTIRHSRLKAFEISKKELPALIDEVPILTVMATQAAGKSVIHDADELRVKETDRIESMVTNLKKMGASIEAKKNTIIIEGPTPLTGARCDSFKDHRTAMSLIVAGLLAKGETQVDDIECINTSFPTFFKLLKKVGGNFEFVDTP